MERLMSTQLIRNSLIHIGFMPDSAEINRQIMAGYLPLREEDLLRRSHFFGGRYENLYIDRNRIPAIARVLEQAERPRVERDLVEARQPLRCERK